MKKVVIFLTLARLISNRQIIRGTPAMPKAKIKLGYIANVASVINDSFHSGEAFYDTYSAISESPWAALETESELMGHFYGEGLDYNYSQILRSLI